MALATSWKQAPRRAGRRGNGEGSIYFRSDKELWVASVTLDGGRRTTLYGRTRAEVAGKLVEALRKVKEGLPFTPERLTLGAWLDYWLEHVVRPEREPTTYEGYEISTRLHIKPYIGSVPLRKVQVEDVERWLRTLEQHGAGSRTRQFALARLRTALHQAERRGHVTRNVASLVDMPRSVRRKVAPPSTEQLHLLLATIRDDHWQALVTVALALGLRRCETLGLQWEDVDLEGRMLTVRRKVSRVRGRLLIREGAKTEAGERTISLPQFIVQALKAHRMRQFQDRLRAGERWKGSEYRDGVATGFLFTSDVGTVIEPRNVNRYFSGVLVRMLQSEHRRLGTPHGDSEEGFTKWKATSPPEMKLLDRTFHGLRHDYASLLLAEGVPLWAVSKMLGHSSIQVTANIYGHLVAELHRDAADRIDSVFAAV